jgi:flagellar hook protein FlgE
MSLFGALNSSVSGLNAQSTAFSNISENVSNAQTVGFKEVNTSFVDYLTLSNQDVNEPGAVVARPDYTNNVQGTVTQTTSPLNMAIAGQGFFAVSQSTGTISNITSFSPQQYYTRTGDFQINANGYLVNSAGLYLNTWPVDPTTGVANQNSLAPLQVPQSVFNPIASSTVQLEANLPATPTAGTATALSPISSNINVYDSLGTQHTLTLNWVQNGTNNWTVSLTAPDSTPSPSLGSADVTFGPASGNPVPSGTIGQIANATGTVTTAGYTAGGAATLNFSANFGSGSQSIGLNLGTYGLTNGVTQYAGTVYNQAGLTQNGVPPGSFASVSAQSDGSIVVNYSNGQIRTIAQVPVVTFAAPDKLQSQNGQAFTQTNTSGTPNAAIANTSGAGNLVTSAVEASNVDIATEFSNLIVAQQAYSANAKMITAANQLLQTTIDMKQ